MLSLSSSDKVFLCIKAIDFRNQKKGLIKFTQQIIQQNPYNRTYFVFTNKRKDSVKILQYDGTGFWMHVKYLSMGKFFWPKTIEDTVAMNPVELQVLLMQGNPVSASFQSEWQQVA